MDRRKFLNFSILAGTAAGFGLLNCQSIKPNAENAVNKKNIPWDRGTRLVL